MSRIEAGAITIILSIFSFWGAYYKTSELALQQKPDQDAVAVDFPNYVQE